ncbi:flavo protein-like protein [Delphinella strobiligena]|nr:flavo protein-like protein [Delphinella strobiligena]
MLRPVRCLQFHRQYLCTSFRASSFRTAVLSLKCIHTSSIRMASGDLNNTSAGRIAVHLEVDESFIGKNLAIQSSDDNAEIRQKYRTFLLDEETSKTDWVSHLELSTVMKMAQEDMNRTGERLKVLVLYGSMRSRSYSRLLALEASRILFRLGCDVRVFDPTGLPVKDDSQHDHVKVQELRNLSRWSDGHIWVSPEQHGNLTAVFKNQIDWIPLSTGSVRPTQGRTLAIAQVSGGSQSFNTVNSLRILGRWMRMFVIPNQSSVPLAYKQFTEPDGAEGGSRMIPSGNRDRLVDCMEEFVKYTIVMREHFHLFGDRFSERAERRAKQVAADAKAAATTNTGNSDVVNGVNIGGI